MPPKKIVHKFPVKQGKDRNKAMQIASGVHGVTSVTIGGDEKDNVIVTGEGVDAHKLTKSLRNEFGSSVTLISMEEVKKPDDKDKKPDDKGNKPEDKDKDKPPPVICQPNCYIYPHPYYNCNTYGRVVCDPNPDGCSIL